MVLNLNRKQVLSAGTFAGKDDTFVFSRNLASFSILGLRQDGFIYEYLGKRCSVPRQYLERFDGPRGRVGRHYRYTAFARTIPYHLALVALAFFFFFLCDGVVDET